MVNVATMSPCLLVIAIINVDCKMRTNAANIRALQKCKSIQNHQWWKKNEKIDVFLDNSFNCKARSSYLVLAVTQYSSKIEGNLIKD